MQKVKDLPKNMFKRVIKMNNRIYPLDIHLILSSEYSDDEKKDIECVVKSGQLDYVIFSELQSEFTPFDNILYLQIHVFPDRPNVELLMRMTFITKEDKYNFNK